MSKPSIVISCPIDTYSGYGARARDFVKAVIDIDKYDVKILPQRWGETRWGYLKDHNDNVFTPRIITQLTQQPDIWVQISIPNEFQKVGKYNIGVTAGIETTLCDPSWIKGANNMDLILASTKHAVDSFNRSKFDVRDDKTGQIREKIELNTKMEVVFEGVDVTKYFPTLVDEQGTINQTLDNIPETFCYLTTGHWMQGDFGEDRKNMGFTIKSFLETFKNTSNPPALVMKSHSVTTSIMDRERMLDKIEEVRKTVKGKLPNIYLIHGEVSDAEMNELYNHPKIKALVSLPKGEGFGRPFLEFSLVNKPIIASSWSGQTDFLDKEFVRYVKGDLTNVHKSAAVKNILLPDALWFSPDPIDVGRALKDVHKNYKKWKTAAKRQAHKSRTQFSYEAMVETLKNILETNIPEFPKQVELSLPKLNLPKLKKVGEKSESPKVQLPKLKKL
jgi:glycosyltransferase involved in cell wall biosynthesis